MKNVYRKLRLAKHFIVSSIRSRELSGIFDRVERFCMFLGYPRSGHTLICALLDAHPDIIVANELNALRYVRYGFSKNQLFYLLLHNSRSFTRTGQTHTGYSYTVPNQWQGRCRELRIIGDKRGGGSVRKLHRDSQLMERLRARVGIEIKFIHVVRNPYDNISTLFLKSKGRDLSECIDYYFSMADGVADLKKRIADREIVDVLHESVIHDPVCSLRNLCGFLGVDAPRDYLDDCASVVFDSPHKTRRNAPWNAELVEVVGKKMKGYPFLAGYSFDG